MKKVSMSGSLRENVGKKDAKAQRNQAKVPCVIYGGEKQIHFSALEVDFKPFIFTPYTYIIDLDVDGKKYQTILKDIQYHPINDNILHADFYEISNDKPITLKVPIRIIGRSTGVLRGGKLIQKLKKLSVKALIKNLPDVIEIDITALDINDAIKVENIKMDNVEFTDPKKNVIVTVASSRGVTDAAGEAQPAK